MIPKDTVEKILETARIEEVVGDFVSLRRRGASYVACCPFHNEKTPSFYVTPAKGIYKCFGCGKAGTAVNFVMEHESLSYPDALRYLAAKYHIEIVEKEETAEEIAARTRVESLYLVSEFASKYFSDALRSGEGRSVGYAYFKSRGLEDQTIEKFGLGWSPTGRNALSQAALSAGYKEEYLVAAGLCVKKEDGTLADKFWDRVMFPIHSVSGRVIAFGGRTLKSGHPAMKYVNTATTEIYAKEKSLYGIWFAKNEIARKDKCLLVEGYLDVLSMHQLGITNVVASSGTSLTTEQVKLIKRFTENVTIMYDGDSAGGGATQRGISLVIKEGLNVKIVRLPAEDDPDSFARKHTLAEVEEYIAANETDFIEYKSSMLLDRAGNDPLKRAEVVNDIADTIALIPDQVKRESYAQSAAAKLNSTAIFDRIKSSRAKLLEQERKEKEHRGYESRQEYQEMPPLESLPPMPEQVVPEDVAPKKGSVMESPLLAPAEEELLGFILNNGLTPLAFQTDSEYFDPEGEETVADFIRDNVEADGCLFENTLYRKVYNAYFALYDGDATLGQEDIIRRLLTDPDPSVAQTTVMLTEEKYRLSVSSFRAAMTNISTRLTTFVPKTLMVYQSKKLQVRINDLTQQLRNAATGEKMSEILTAIKDTEYCKRYFDEKLGRVQ